MWRNYSATDRQIVRAVGAGGGRGGGGDDRPSASATVRGRRRDNERARASDNHGDRPGQAPITDNRPIDCRTSAPLSICLSVCPLPFAISYCNNVAVAVAGDDDTGTANLRRQTLKLTSSNQKPVGTLRK